MPAVSSAAGIWATSHGTAAADTKESPGSYSSGNGRPTTAAAHMNAAIGYERSSPGISWTTQTDIALPAGHPSGASTAAVIRMTQSNIAYGVLIGREYQG